jgi:hypothetical protein
VGTDDEQAFGGAELAGASPRDHRAWPRGGRLESVEAHTI